MQSLKEGILLQGGKYEIERTLGQGGFAITYLATQDILDRKVAIKEFFFRDYCERDGDTSHVTLGTQSNKDTVERFLKKFIKEARTISGLHHPAIIPIYDIFRENGTAYYVMEYIEGESLGDMEKRRGALPEAEALSYIRSVGDALTYIHQRNINHLDVKPSNIMLRRSDKQIILIDFGVAKQYDEQTKEGTTTTPVGISHGYSPAEQYKKNGVQTFSPQSDVYALAATLFKLLTGQTPPEATEIPDVGLPIEELRQKGVSASVINAIEKAMKPRRSRTQSVAEFIANLFKGEDSIDDVDKEETEVIDIVELMTEPKPKQTKSSKPTSIQPTSSSSQTITANGVSFKMICVDGGTFTMGATSEQGSDAYGDEKPAHRVTLSTYYIGETEVTQALWEAVMGSNPSNFIGENRPVENVSWKDCQKFISKLNSITGKNFRLPTEAEWEYAARGGNKSLGYKYSGSNTLGNVAWYTDNSGSETHPVKTKSPNELGLYDMSGNVREWCQDWKGSYNSSSETDPTGPSSGSNRVNRGGGLGSNARGCRVSIRFNDPPDLRVGYLGLRLALASLIIDNPNKKQNEHNEETTIRMPSPNKRSQSIHASKSTFNTGKSVETKLERFVSLWFKFLTVLYCILIITCLAVIVRIATVYSSSVLYTYNDILNMYFSVAFASAASILGITATILYIRNKFKSGSLFHILSSLLSIGIFSFHGELFLPFIYIQISVVTFLLFAFMNKSLLRKGELYKNHTYIFEAVILELIALLFIFD